MAEFKKKERISDGKLYLMILAAITIEFFQLVLWIVFIFLGMIPFVGIGFILSGVVLASIISISGYLGFWIWFKMSGVHFSDIVDVELIFWFYGTAILEASLFGFLPLFTLGVIRTAHLVRKKDAEYNKKHAPKSVSSEESRPSRLQRLRDSRIERLSDEYPRAVDTATRRVHNTLNTRFTRGVPASKS